MSDGKSNDYNEKMPRKQTRYLVALDKVMKPVMHKRNRYETPLLLHWPDIVGADIAQQSSPLAVKGKSPHCTLHLAVYDSGFALELSYMENMLLEKIASYVGYKAIDKITISRRPQSMQRNALPARPHVAKKVDLAPFEALLTEIEDDELQASLRAFATSVLKN
jgi:hypothetical protein